MKKGFTYLLLLCIAGFFTNPVKAQQKIAPSDVKKIIVTGGTDNNESFELQILDENGKWNSYQTAETDYEANSRLFTLQRINRVKIGTLSAEQISNFLKCVAVVKPELDVKALHLTAAALIAGIKKTSKDTANNTIQLDNIITEAKVEFVLTHADGIVGPKPYFCIMLIKAGSDTLKIKVQQYETMLPWTINDKAITYNMGINDFIIAAMCGRYYDYKWLLTLRHLKQHILEGIEELNTAKPISTYRWKYCYTDNIKLLEDNFKPGYKVSESHNTDNKYYWTLKTDVMPSNMHLYTTVSMEDREDILAVINYGKLLEKYLKHSNFVFKYYSDRPKYTIGVGCYPNSAPDPFLGDARRHLPALKNMNLARAVQFTISTPGQYPDWYLLLPNNKVVIGRRFMNNPDGIFTPVFPPDDTKKGNSLSSTFRYVLFNSDGTMVK